MNNMILVHDLIARMAAAPGKLDKEAILRDASGLSFRSALQDYLRHVYEPRINFWLTKKVFPKVRGTGTQKDLEFNMVFFNKLITKISEREITGNAARDWVIDAYNSFEHDWERDLLYYLIDRDVRAGFGINTINKVWKDLITDVPYMRCCLTKHTDLAKFSWNAGVFSQVKADGMFAAANSTVGGVHIFSRNGSPFPNDAFPELIQSIKNHIPMGYQVHGELLIMKGKEMLPRQEGNGMLNKLLKGGDLPKGHKVVYHVWDTLPIIEAVAKNKYHVPYSKRFKDLTEYVAGASLVHLIESRTVHSFQDAMEHYSDALDRGLEGTVIKDGSMIWEDTTSKKQVKMKLEVTVELKVVGFNPGNNKNADTFGSIRCESSDGKLKVSCHGFTDAMRQEIWNEHESWINKAIVTVKSNGIMPPTNKDYYSLFLPIFIERRLDKTKADSLDAIQEQFAAAMNPLNK